MNKILIGLHKYKERKMLITLKEGAPKKEREALLLRLVSCGLHPQLSQLDEMPIIGIEKNLSKELNN